MFTMATSMNITKHLKKFDKKRTPDNGRISLLYENAINYDMYSVYIKDANGVDYLFERFIDGEIKALKWNPEESRFDMKSILYPKDLMSDSFSGIYYYHAHEWRFHSLRDLSKWNEFVFRLRSDFENKKLSRQKYIYRQQKKEITDIMSVLDAIVRLYREHDGDHGFSEYRIMNAVAGELWIHHEDKTRMQKELRLCLDSLVENGDIEKIQTEYKPLGKALNTLAEFNRAERRYQETILSQNKMFWATLFSALAAIGSAYAAFKGLNIK
jgi:molecular chaperone GrpE (heat shock protein)